MIEKFYTKLFTIIRDDWAESGGIWASVEDEVGTFKGHLQQANPQIITNLALNLSTTYSVWCPINTNVILGDKLRCDGVFYSVRYIQDNSFVGLNKHLELIVEKEMEENESGS